MRETGHFGTTVPLDRSGDLAELIGVILGDGHIQVFPRTERLTIFSNSSNPGFVDRYSRLIEHVFNKTPHIAKTRDSNCVRISVYQTNISIRLVIPSGSRKKIIFKIPRWIYNNHQFLIRFLRGLYEAEGSLSYHPPTYTHKLSFSNKNPSLLRGVAESLLKLGFHPHSDRVRVQISRKREVQQLKNLIQFRRY